MYTLKGSSEYVYKTSEITRTKAAVPGGRTFSNLPAARS
ncbi:unnamed protein product [Tetraodon nigroviridis]|uniref:(spotted green pufferfish) hypothetical protein n=1 Tax=Tetraodon nigroviridis TaxID=99883 RepID=Q4RVH7_TETNG|nr:unnamed protein product [Tetraodon nigroviridis]